MRQRLPLPEKEPLPGIFQWDLTLLVFRDAKDLLFPGSDLVLDPLQYFFDNERNIFLFELNAESAELKVSKFEIYLVYVVRHQGDNSDNGFFCGQLTDEVALRGLGNLGVVQKFFEELGKKLKNFVLSWPAFTQIRLAEVELLGGIYFLKVSNLNLAFLWLDFAVEAFHEEDLAALSLGLDMAFHFFLFS